MRKLSVVLVALVAAAGVISSPAAATPAAKQVQKSFDITLPPAGGQTLAHVTIRGKKTGALKITPSAGNLDQISPDIRMAAAVTKATTKHGKTTVDVLVAINNLAPGNEAAVVDQAPPADALELIVIAAGLRHPSEHLEEFLDDNFDQFCGIGQNYFDRVAKYVELAAYGSPPEGIFQNVWIIDGGCSAN